MSRESYDTGVDVYSLVLQEIARLDERVKISKESRQKRYSLESGIASYNATIEVSTKVADSLQSLIKDLTEFVDKKRRASKAALDRALTMAEQVIPAASSGMRFEIEGERACIVTAKGTRAVNAEGSGYKGAASLFCRSAVLQANNERLQTMFLDEVLSKVSTENSVNVSVALEVLPETQQIIMIEQKKEVFASTQSVCRFKFHKQNGITVVEREEEGSA